MNTHLHIQSVRLSPCLACYVHAYGARIWCTQMILTTPVHVMWAWLVRDLMAAYVQESELVSFFIYSPDLGRKEGTVS